MRRALVIGGSITGLATAQALSRHFDEVQVLERDRLPVEAETRAGVPQGRQLHLLLRRGQEVLDELLPGFADELEQRGAVRVRWGGEIRWYHFGGWKQPNQSPHESLFCTRLLVESLIRRRIHQNDRIRLVENIVVEGLLVENGRALGVRLDDGQTIADAELVVDASGRETRAPEWLRREGLTPPTEEKVDSHLGYATRMYRCPPGHEGWKALIIHATPPQSTRLIGIIPIEPDAEGPRWHVVLAGVNRDYPPTDEHGFLEFARNLARPDAYDALLRAQPMGSIYGYRKTANRLYRYDRLPAYLNRFVALGDAVCAFNPVYAQGMTTGTIAAKLLGETVADTPLDRLAPIFQRRLAKALRVPWFLATTEDFRYPETEGKAPGSAVRALQTVIDHLIRRSAVDQRAYDAFWGVMHMTRGPSGLIVPSAIASLLGPAPREALEPPPPARHAAPVARAAGTSSPR